MIKRYQPGVYQVLAGQYECEMSDDDAGDYVLHSDYAELVEAVRWEMECSMPNMAGVISDYTHHLYMTHGEDYLDEIQEEYEEIVAAARAAVDALVEEG